MRKAIVICSSMVFGIVWVFIALSVFVPASLAGDFEPERWFFVLVPFVLSLFGGLAFLFARAHWRSGWPFGGFFRLPGCRAWTVAFAGGFVILLFGTVLPLPDKELASIGIVGGADGPTSIFLAPDYSWSDVMPRVAGLSTSAAVILIVAYAMRRKDGEPGATDNPDDAQRLREDH